MKPIDLIPIKFNVHRAVRGRVDHIEILHDHFVVYGDVDPSYVENIWIAPTGGELPINIVAHIQTLSWDNGNYVAHVFELDGPPDFNGGVYDRVWREFVRGYDFELNVSAEFINIELEGTAFNVWFITDTLPIAGDRYTITRADNAKNQVVFKTDDWAIVHTAMAVGAVAPPSNAQQIPDSVENGLVFEYEKQDGSQRLVRCARIEYKVINDRQALNAWDLDRKDWRTFYWDQIVRFPAVRSQ